MDGLGVKYAGRVNVVWQNIDDPATRKVVQKYGVRSIPTFALLDSSDQVMGHWLGLQSPKVFEKAFACVGAVTGCDLVAR